MSCHEEDDWSSSNLATCHLFSSKWNPPLMTFPHTINVSVFDHSQLCCSLKKGDFIWPWRRTSWSSQLPSCLSPVPRPELWRRTGRNGCWWVFKLFHKWKPMFQIVPQMKTNVFKLFHKWKPMFQIVPQMKTNVFKLSHKWKPMFQRLGGD